MTLHSAIEKLLRRTGRPMTTQQVADELNRNGQYKKKDNSNITAFQIHGRTKNYTNLFDRNGAVVFLIGQTSTYRSQSKNIRDDKKVNRTTVLNVKDEHYVLDICDKALGFTFSTTQI